MSSYRFKKLKSARQTLKYESISVPVSLKRLRNVQEIVEQTGVDAILCILGLDSRYNEGCTELADYLCFDFFNYKPGVTEQKIEDEIIDDVIFFVKKRSVDVYCNPINYYFLLPYISHWHNLRLHCLRESDYVDEESSQDFKIESLIRITAGCQKIGVPYFGSIDNGKQAAEFDKMLIEKWPVIQAFALEDFSGGGFFTLKFEVSDISQPIAEVFQKIDPVTMETIIARHLPSFEKQWNTMVTNLTIAGPSATPDLPERAVSEPLRSYLTHGKLGSGESASRYPFVLFGTHSTRETFEAAQCGAKASMTTSQQASLYSTNAHHMVGQIIAPKLGIGAVRTYFFEPKMEANVPNGDGTNMQKKDFIRLQEIYVGCVKSVMEAIHIFGASNDITMAKDEALKVLKENFPVTESNAEFKIVAYDQFHRAVNLDGKTQSRHLKSAQMTVFDIPSEEYSGRSLGSVSFAETFYESNFQILHPDSDVAMEGNCHILTENIPRYITWPTNELHHSLQTLSTAAGLGHCLLQGEEVGLLNPTCHTYFKNGPVYIYEAAILLAHQNTSPILLTKEDFKHLALYDGDSPSVVALLILTLKDEAIASMSPNLRSSRSELVLSFTPKTASYKQLFSQVLRGWKSNTMLPLLERIETIPDHLVSVHSQLQEAHLLGTKPTKDTFKLAQQKQPNIHRFLKHLEVSSCLENNPVLSRHLSAFVGDSSDPGTFEDDELLLTIVAGTTGSHKENLCRLLTNMAKDDNRWALLRQPAEQSANFSPRSLQANLAAVFKQFKQKQNNSKSTKKRRAIVLTPGYADLAAVVQAIVNHPDPEIGSTLRIGAVTTCVNPENSFMVDRYLFPKLLEQCTYGLVNNIVFTGPTDKPGPLNEIQSLLRIANPDVNFMIAEKGMVTRTPDMDLILSETAFNEAAQIKARYLTCPGWAQGQFVPGPVIPSISETVVRFAQPLSKDHLLKKLRGLRSSLKSHPFTDNIYSLRGHFKITGEESPVSFTHFVLSGETDLCPADHQPQSPSKVTSEENDQAKPYYMVFNGCELREDWLRNWLRDCVPQKLEKRPLRTRESITKVEIKKIHQQHHLDPLPDGWFYNGHQFLSMAGDRSTTHPDFEVFLSQYLEEINRDIEELNAQVDTTKQFDLFE